MADSTITEALAGIRKLTANPPKDKAAREELANAIKDLLVEVEAPHDTIFRVIYSPLVLTMTRVAIDLDVFHHLKDSSGLESSVLAERTSCDQVLMGRLLRYLASHRIITEVKEDTFTANSVTRTLDIKGFKAAVRHSTEALMPCFDKTPTFLKDSQYKNPDNVIHSPFQVGHNTDQPAFVWAMERPELVANFNQWMVDWHDGHKTWLDVYDFPAHIQETTGQTVIFVDVAGGLGQQCQLLKQRHPNIKGRVVLQELAMTIPHAFDTPGVEKEVVDMWEGQSIKGARFYYMRNVLHDYPTDRCIELLKLTATSMAKESVLIIDEMVIPDRGVHARATDTDMVMLTSLAAMERTEKQWKELVGAAGLKIVSMTQYIEGTGESVIEVVLA